jgi:DnaJ-class molecular chaperone
MDKLFTNCREVNFIDCCQKCNGSGIIECRNCNGKGYCEQVSDYQLSNNSSDIQLMSSYNTCPQCTGKGSATCDRCDGTGEFTKPRNVAIKSQENRNQHCSNDYHLQSNERKQPY